MDKTTASDKLFRIELTARKNDTLHLRLSLVLGGTAYPLTEEKWIAGPDSYGPADPDCTKLESICGHGFLLEETLYALAERRCGGSVLVSCNPNPDFT